MSEDTKRRKSVDVKLDLETAVDLADFFVAMGPMYFFATMMLSNQTFEICPRGAREM